jgi:hypothetical protein
MSDLPPVAYLTRDGQWLTRAYEHLDAVAYVPRSALGAQNAAVAVAVRHAQDLSTGYVMLSLDEWTKLNDHVRELEKQIADHYDAKADAYDDCVNALESMTFAGHVKTIDAAIQALRHMKSQYRSWGTKRRERDW